MNLQINTIVKTKPDSVALHIRGAREVFDRWAEAREIRAQCRLLAEQVIRERDLTVVTIQRGASPFQNMLGRYIHDIDASYGYIDTTVVARRYGSGQESSTLQLFHQWIDESEEISGRNVLILDDVLETGQTAQKTYTLLASMRPKDLHVVFVIRKEGSKLPGIDHSCLFEVPATQTRDDQVRKLWLVGFGMDDGLKYRNLEDVVDKNSGRTA